MSRHWIGPCAIPGPSGALKVLRIEDSDGCAGLGSTYVGNDKVDASVGVDDDNVAYIATVRGEVIC